MVLLENQTAAGHGAFGLGDFADMDQVAGISARVTLAQTMMTTLADREALARTVLGAARVLRRDR